MAVNNRTEIKTAVTTALVPTLTLAQHITLLNDEVNESTVFRKDVIASETPIGAAVTIDYSDKDTATVTITVSTTVSFTNIENGDVKYLVITKGAGNTISFAGATDLTNFNIYINSQAGIFLYSISNKNGVIYTKASTGAGTFDPARLPLANTTAIGAAERTTQAEVDGGIDNARIVTPSTLRGTLFVDAQIPDLDAARITTGTFAAALMPLATETAVGARELATQAETDGGTNDITIVTPLKLRTTTFVASQLPDASQSAKGIQENANTTEAQALSSTTLTITPGTLNDVITSSFAGLKQKVVEIGDWDMDTNSLPVSTLTHGLTLANIRSVEAYIRADVGASPASAVYPLSYAITGSANDAGGAVNAQTTNIGISRRASAFFDSTGFNDTSYNRGWVIISYV